MLPWWPQVNNRLVALLPTLPGWSAVVVYDGPPVTEDYAEQYATVGYVQDTVAGTYRQDRDTVDTLVREVGDVRVHLVVRSGDDDLPGLRGQAFTLASALDDAMRADGQLGLLPEGSNTSLAVDVLSRQDQDGTAFDLVLTFTYDTAS